LWHAFNKGAALVLTLVLAGCAGTGGPTPERHASGGSAAVDPATARAFQTGLAHMREQRYAEAVAVFQRLVEEQSSLPGPHVNLGIAYARLGRREEALVALQTAVQLDPDNAEAHNELGILHREAGRFEAARTHYEKSLAARPDYAIAHRNLGILCDIYLQDLSCAADHYQRYQQLAAGADKQAAMWLADIERRIANGGG
jgi:Flp pilus assembly protein TadD